jgi:hypothetical protein
VLPHAGGDDGVTLGLLIQHLQGEGRKKERGEESEKG